MTQLTNDEVHQIMMRIPESWRYRWCGGGWCGCMGCTNVSGALMTNTLITKDQWDVWVASNPEPATDPSMDWCNDERTPPTPLTQLQQRLDAYKASKV